MKEKIKNYTSEVPVERTVSAIEKLLVENKALDIMKNYDAKGDLIAISFRVERHNKRFSFQLPANVLSVGRVMYGSEQAFIHSESRFNQVKRTAWRCVFDWVSIQMAMITMQQADICEVFLPYMLVGEKTFYKSLLHNNFGGMGTALNP